MDKIEIELNLNSITDTLKSLAEGIKETRTSKLIDVKGKGISITITCNKEDHFLKDWDKNMFIDTAIFTMVLTGPKTKQASIEEFGNGKSDKPKPKPKAKKGRPAKAKEIDAFNELLGEEITEET